MWSRKIVGKVRIFDNRKAEEMDIIKRIKKDRTREKEIVQALQRKDGLAWEEDEVVYKKEEYTYQITRTSRKKF